MKYSIITTTALVLNLFNLVNSQQVIIKDFWSNDKLETKNAVTNNTELDLLKTRIIGLMNQYTVQANNKQTWTDWEKTWETSDGWGWAEYIERTRSVIGLNCELSLAPVMVGKDYSCGSKSCTLEVTHEEQKTTKNHLSWEASVDVGINKVVSVGAKVAYTNTKDNEITVSEKQVETVEMEKGDYCQIHIVYANVNCKGRERQEYVQFKTEFGKGWWVKEKWQDPWTSFAYSTPFIQANGKVLSASACIGNGQ